MKKIKNSNTGTAIIRHNKHQDWDSQDKNSRKREK